MAYLLRRTYAEAVGRSGAAFGVFWKDRARFYSYLHRVWVENQSDKPVYGSGRKGNR